MNPVQNFENHPRMVPLYHYVTFGVLALTLVGSVINLVKAMNADEGVYSASLIVALTVGATLAAYFARTFALGVQDRVIRAEENFRHHLRTGKGLDPALTAKQIVALRFAPDDEFDALAERAVKEGLSPKAIKQSIKNWRGDYNRI